MYSRARVYVFLSAVFRVFCFAIAVCAVKGVSCCLLCFEPGACPVALPSALALLFLLSFLLYRPLAVADASHDKLPQGVLVLDLVSRLHAFILHVRMPNGVLFTLFKAIVH